MEPSNKVTAYHPQHYFHYPFTLVSQPKKSFLSKPIQQPTAFEVYCPISCKKIKIGAAKTKQKEGVQFNTTSSRLVSVVLNKQIKYLINGNPPNKRDKKQVQGSDWSFWIEVSQKGNIAIFNPYCYIPNDPLSLYTFSHLTKFQHPPALPQFSRLTDKLDYQTIRVENNTIYLKQFEGGSFVSTNTHFDDAVNGELTFTDPSDQNRIIKLRTEEALKLIPAVRHFWLHQLHIHMIAEKESQSSIPLHNLDQVYKGFGFALNLEEQLRAKLSNNEGINQLDSKLGYHPRLYSAINRLASFINYGITKYDRRKLVQLGFYNRSDMLQDLRFFQKPQISIPSAQNPWYQSEADLRRKLFPFSRMERRLPNSNVPLTTFTNSLLYQQISSSKIKFHEVFGPYILFIDQQNTISVWSCRLFPIKLFSFSRKIEFQPMQTQIPTGEKQLEAMNNHLQKDDNCLLSSLFEQVPPVQKEQKPVPAQIVPDPSMIQQMTQMGYGIGLIKKALIAVKNQSIPAALDVMDQLMSEQKKKIKEKKSSWNCPSCTFLNKPQSDTCEICGEIYVFVDQSQKERQRLQKEAQQQKQRKQKEQKQKALRQAEEAKKKAELQEIQRLKKIQQKEQMLKKAQLIDTKFIYRQKSPIDPFFILQLLWNNELQKCYLKIMRAGVSRRFFARFYRVQEKILSSNLKRFPMPINLESFEKIAEQSVDQRQWGVRLIEPSHENEWGVISIQQIELNSKFSNLQINGDYITLKSQSEEIFFELKIKDTIQKADFQVVASQKPNFMGVPKLQVAPKQQQQQKSSIETIQIKVGQELNLDSQVSQIQVEVLQHLPGGVWVPSSPQSLPSGISTAKQGQVVINQLIPLFIQEFEGSVFSGKHYSTTVLQKSANLYISNYPNINFTFRHLNGKSVFAQSVIIISSTKRLQRIFSVYEGLIFTADQPSWFHIAKQKFQKFTKSDYQQWLTTKKARNQHRQFWEPVAFFQFEGETQIEIDYKRTAKYVFLLPTNVKGGQKKKDQVYAVKVDFFGIKGRVEDDKNLVKGSFKNEGHSGCTVQLQRQGEPIDQHNIVSKVWGNVNSFHFHTPNLNHLMLAPLSTTTVFLYKLRSKRQPFSLKVSSQYAKKVTVRLSREVNEDIVDSSAINSFSELARVQNDFSAAQLKKIAQKLQPRDLLHLLLVSERQVSSYQALIKKLEQSIDFKEKLFLIILELLPKLVDNEIQVTQAGFKSFLTLYEKQIGNQPNLAFSANTDALRKISRYVSQNRNKNYNILRSKYNISELILQPYLFSKDYYRMVYPNYVEEEVVPPVTSEPSGPVNCYLYTEQITPYFYRYIVDLKQIKKIDTVKFYAPKITSVAFRPKLSINIWKIDDKEETLIYSRYFHEDLMVQLGINGFKDAQIYRGQRLNCLTVPDVQTQARFLKVQYSFILATSQPHIKYKDYNDKYLLIPLIEGRKTDKQEEFANLLQSLKKYPQQTKHFHNFEKLPPCRYSSDGSKSTYSVHQFPVIELSAVKKEYREIIEKITANIMDQNMVKQAIKGLKISNYEFNRKGIDFAYTYIIHLMNLSKRFPNQMHVSVELMLELFEVLVVFESGPIMRRTFAFLEDNYKRLSHPQRVAFVDALMAKYLQSVQSLPNLRIVERYSPLKILEKLQSFELPIANIFVRLEKTTRKSFKILLLKLISSYLTSNPIKNLELYSSQTGKYIRHINLLDILLTTFSTSIWVLNNVTTVKQQIISQTLDLLLLLMSGDLGAEWKEPQTVALKQFIASINVQDIWRVVFLSLKLKSQSLKNKINKLFGILTNNLTEKFKRSINDMLQQIIMRKEGSLYVNINPVLTDELWMNHLQTTLELVSVTKDSLFLDLEIALKLLELPLTPGLWSLALLIIPRNDQVLNSIIKNFPTQFYSTLGKEITSFCEPLAGIRSPESIHINWLQLVRKIRLQGKNLVQLLAEQLEKSSFGGREGLTMATTNQLKQLQIACQLAKLVTEGKTTREHFNESIIRKLVLWYFLNKSKEKGASPATQKILVLSQAVRQLLGKLAQFQQTTKLALKILLEIRREGQLVERNFLQKRIPVHSALTLNKRFCECFEELLNLFMTTDQLCGYFAFELKGLQYILRTIDIQAPNATVLEQSSADQELLVSQKIIYPKMNGEKGADVKEPEDLKEQQFANNVKIMPNLNLAGLHASNVDWTIYKKGNKTKIVFLSMVEPGYYNQHPLYIQLTKTAQIRSLKIGFPAASYQYNDKLVATPSGIIVEGSLDGVNFQPIGQMDYLRDDAYIMSGVQVWVLNCQRLKGLKSVGDAVQGLGVHKAKYLKIIVKRPIITFIEGQYSQLNGRNYSNLGCSLSFLSVTGDDAQKITSWQGCRQASKRSVLRVLANLLNQSNNRTKRRIANDQHFSGVVKTNFKRIRQYMTKYGEIMPQIIYLVGAGNRDLGDWIVSQFLSEGGAQSEAKIVNQIITSTPDRAFNRLSRFLKSILQKLNTASAQTQIESALIYSQEIHFIQSFCKTLEESYQLGIENGTLQVSLKNITSIINIYDRRFSSPDVKSAVKLLVNLLYLKKPLQLSENLILPAMNLVWQNCSDQKPHFYQLMSALLVDRGASAWLTDSKYSKVAQLIQQTYSSCTHSELKSLKLQLLLLSQISHHEPAYLRESGVHVELYNRVKVLNYQENDITEAVLKLMRNVVLGNQQEERRMAKLLFDDVGLLVRRKDPLLQKLFVGLLGLEQQVMINLQGLQLQNNTKKQVNFKSKYLTYKQSKNINDKINKKCKFNLLGQINGQIKADHQELFLKAFSCNSFIMVLRFKINDQIHTCGVYSSTPGRRNQEGDYLWEELVYYEKNSFIFFLQDPQPLFINNEGTDSLLGNVYGGEQEQENGAMFYDEGTQVFQFTFNTTESTVPKIFLNKYKQKLSNELTNSTLDSDHSSYSFIGIQFWELKAPTLHVADSKISNLLSKSNHAKPPFSYYRHYPIYIFPANITVSKFMGILGIKGSCYHHTNLVPQQQVLANLQRLSTDFVIDLNIQSLESQIQKEEVNELGYIPVMRIFNHFSAMDGVGEVLRLGSQSIKDWKKADRKKNFQHYMQELKSFINLPSFFNLFIKNQQYVTLLFEVASGMPDDESSTRNWEEEYVNNFRFIYKIVSDIFKFDRSADLRDMDRYSDFVQVILEKLSQITKQASRVLKEQQTTEQKNELGVPSLSKAKSEDRKRKKKGTGYGSDNQNSSKWSASQWLQARKNVSQETLRVISIIASFLDCQVPLKDNRLSDIIKESCLLPLLESAVRSGSLLDISKEPELFKAYLQIIKLISSHPSIIDCVLDLDKKYKPQQSESIYSLLGKLNGTATIFSECLKSGKDQSSNETAEGISIDIQKTYQYVDKSVKNMKKKGKGLTIKEINSMPVAEAYRILLGGLRFGYINIKEGNTFKHAHSSSISTSNPATSKILRLSQELADLSTSLPCEHTNSIFVRCDQSRIDVITIMIMGSKDTPYSNGAFTFDVYCDDSYPNNPPKMLITTTGSGKIRFNPNLYSCGKVCLSLLGTWRGSASQNWDPKVSTLLQLFISTQGITMSDDVYFNEPGFEGEQGTEEGERKNEAYSNIVRLGNVRYAMNGQLKNPPKGFEDVVRRHFYIKQKQIIQQCQKWVQWAQKRQASYNGLVNDHNSTWCTELKQSKTKYKELLVKQVEQLKQLLSKLPAPDMKQKQQQPAFLEQKSKEKKQVKAVDVKLQEVDVEYDKQPHQIKEYGEQILQDRWSRYIGAMGLQAVKKQAESSVLLIGLKPLGLQIAKNLVLSGLKKLTILQNQTLQNTSEHFYMANVKSNNYKDCIFKIKELNPYMLVQYVDVLPDIANYSIVVSTAGYQFSRTLAEKARKHGVKFIYTETKGVSGVYFADLGQHQVNDDNGEEPFQGMIKNITNEEEGLVTLLEGLKHPYQDGDYIVLSRVEGMQTIAESIEQKSEAQIFFEKQSNQKTNGINNRVYKIKVINWNSFRIGDTRNFTPYKNNGLCRNLKVPKKLQFEALQVCSEKFQNYLDPNLGIYDFEKIGENLSIFLCFKALSNYEATHKTLPANWSIKDNKEFLTTLESLAKTLGKSQQDIQSILNFGRKFGFISEAQLPTIGAYLGGIVSQQIVKAITNKYTPIKQFFTFHFNQLMQKVPQAEQEIQKLSIKKEEQFKNIKMVVGKSAAAKIQELKTFVIGAGAIGCELLKNFAMVNMGSKGQIVVTDPDHIQTSNLSRQFLFREKHVKKAKSATACATLLQLNPKLQGHLHARLDKVCQESEEIYSDQFFKSRNIVANALDNVKARQYMDKRCVQNKVPLFESGTLGPKGHVQVIVPYKTENYGSQNDPNEQAQIPHCTLKMFPEETVHCIQWARDIFGKMFTLNPKAFKKVIQAKDIKVLEGQQRETVAKMIKYRPESFQDCIAQAVRKFNIYYRNNVRQLLFTYPIEMKTKEGKPFWTLPKRPPKQINELDSEDEVHRSFISAYSVLLAKIYSLPYPKDFRKKEQKDNTMSIAKKVKVQDFVPNAQASKQLQKEVEKEAKKQQMTQSNVQQIAQTNKVQTLISEQIELTEEILETKPAAQEFEKDQDSNGHIDLIYSMSNLRCRNYGLNECTWIEAKLKAGKIMAALSTTTSVVAALQTLQIIKLATGGETWRNAFTNLAVPIIQISEPGPAAKHEIGNTTFTVWQEWTIKCSSLKELLTKLKQTYNVEAYNISLKSGKPVYWQAMYVGKEQSKQQFLNTKLKTMFEDNIVQLNIAMRKVQGGENYENVPKVKIEIQQ